MAKGLLVIVKDMQGWRFAYTKDDKPWDGVFFHLDNGMQVAAKAYLATEPNLETMVRGGTPLEVEDQTHWPLDAELASDLVKRRGYGVDVDFRIRPTLGSPFMDIKPGHIPAIIAIHLKSCQERGKNPETEPIALVWFEVPEMGEGPRLCQLFDKNSLVPVPMDNEHPGKFALCIANPISGHKQICLTWQDYHLIPKGSNTLMMYKYLNTEEGFDTLEELINQGNFIDKDGIVRKDGSAKLSMRTISIDDFFKETT